MITELDRLIEAVEAEGDLKMSSVIRSPVSRWGSLVMASFDGSLDAAVALLEALLPDWCIDDWSQRGTLAGHPWGCRVEYWNGPNPSKNKAVSAGWGHDDLPSDNPARALLLATLRAYRSTREDG